MDPTICEGYLVACCPSPSVKSSHIFRGRLGSVPISMGLINSSRYDRVTLRFLPASDIPDMPSSVWICRMSRPGRPTKLFAFSPWGALTLFTVISVIFLIIPLTFSDRGLIYSEIIYQLY